MLFFVSPANFTVQKSQILTMKGGEIRQDLNDYLESLVSTPVRSLEELIQWNKDNPEAQAGLGKPSLYKFCV